MFCKNGVWKMRAEEILIKALKRADNERGLRLMNPNNHLSSGHIKMADHNLVVMTDLDSLGHEDWVVIAAYYAMYQAALALLTKSGMESKEHAATVAVLEYFFGEQLGRELIGKFNEMREKKGVIEAVIIQEKYIGYMWKTKRARETIQYGISMDYREADVIMKNAREFVSKIKLAPGELDEKMIGIITKRKGKLNEIAMGSF